MSIFQVSPYLPEDVRIAANAADRFLSRNLGPIVFSKKGAFTYTKMSHEEIFRSLQNEYDLRKSFDKKILLMPIVPKNARTKMIATTFKDHPDHVFFNVNKVKYTLLRSKFITIIHEFCHLAGFGHGNNYLQHSTRKRNSVPIWVAHAAADWFDSQNFLNDGNSASVKLEKIA